MKDAGGLPTLLETFFTKRLIAQRRASPHTIASYVHCSRKANLSIVERQAGVWGCPLE